MSDFIFRIVGNYIPSFQMISKEYFEVGVDQWLNWGIDVVIVSTCIWCIFNSVILNKSKILDNLNIFDISISSHQLSNCILIDIIEPTNKQLSNKNHFMNFLWWSCLISQLLLFPLGHMHVCFLKIFIVMEIIIS